MRRTDAADPDKTMTLDAGSLSIVRSTPNDPASGGFEIYIVIDANGQIFAYNGHVDLGTGIRTALTQIVAEELDVALDRVTMVLGDTTKTPNQGPTIASETIQITAVPLRNAAAQARHYLLARAAEQLDQPLDSLSIEDGLIRAQNNHSVSYAELVAGKTVRLELRDDVTLKDVNSYKLVGRAIPRLEIPAMTTGEMIYVHDVRVPGMLHGRVVRPPYAGVDAGDFVGTSLIAVDESSVADIPGLIAVVRIGDFVGVVTDREENAIRAAAQLKLTWKPTPTLPDLKDIATALRTNPSTPRVLRDTGDVDDALANAATPMPRTYVWPYHIHGSIGPSCSVADYTDSGLRVWTGSQNPHNLRTDLAKLMTLPEAQIDVIRLEAAGCYGRNGADDVSADAALLSRAVGRPVRVQLSREQEHAWDPKGTGQLMEVNGGLDANGEPIAYDFATRYPSNAAPTLALLLTGAVPPGAATLQMGDRTAIPPYDYPAMRVVAHDMAPIVRASWFRGVSALPNSFAHESYIDELATAAGVDPVEYRLRYLKDERAAKLVRDVAERAKWEPRPAWTPKDADGDVVHGRGFAYAVYVHGPFPGKAAAWSAWVADVAVNKATGDVAVTHVTVGQDSGLVINPDGVRHQIHGNVIQSTSRALMEEVTFEPSAVASREWGGYPIITFPDVPTIDVVIIERQDQPPLGVGESASVPSAAAIANAIFDATGVRFRELPFTPDRIRAGLLAADNKTKPASPLKKRGLWAGLATLCTAVVGLIVAASPWRPAIAPISPPDISTYSAATIARGAQLAALGDCAVCHTADGGIVNAGGRTLETPFGTVIATNITPDVETGIGAWSYPAFERAMRQGIHRDGRHLYPAFPYNHFAKTSEADLQALYAYLMAQPAVRQTNPETKLAFPLNLRPLLAGWNLLFHSPAAFAADPTQSEAWNRGAYLVEGLGHCGACHTPRNALGAEKASLKLAGGTAEGWTAPPLTSLSHAPIPWSEQELFTYLRSGISQFHGVAAGPMAPVVKELGALPDNDIRAMATYLASFTPNAPAPEAQQAMAARLETITSAKPLQASQQGARIYDGACAVCHEPGGPQWFGSRPSLALNSNLHGTSPDNLARVIVEGITQPVNGELGAMPGFAHSLNDQQLTELIRYLRTRFAPDKPAWGGIDTALKAARGGMTR